MRIRKVKDWQMMLLVHVLGMPYEAFYPPLNPGVKLRDAFAEMMAKRTNRGAAPRI